MLYLKEGANAPAFSGKDEDGKTIKLEDFRGKKMILYFYPEDDTPGCTAEACDLKDNYNFWLSRGYDVIGVSPDSVKSHRRFKKKYKLPFHLVSDPDKEIINAYRVWGEKSLFGRNYMGVLRTTYVINEAGTIEKVITRVESGHHSSQLIQELSVG